MVLVPMVSIGPEVVIEAAGVVVDKTATEDLEEGLEVTVVLNKEGATEAALDV